MIRRPPRDPTDPNRNKSCSSFSLSVRGGNNLQKGEPARTSWRRFPPGDRMSSKSLCCWTALSFWRAEASGTKLRRPLKTVGVAARIVWKGGGRLEMTGRSLPCPPSTPCPGLTTGAWLACEFVP